MRTGQPERTLITTADGSKTIFVSELKETYHSTHGAINESQHIFINAGLLFAANIHEEIQLLEIGLGTGLNLLLTYLAFTKTPELKINYTAIEPFPLPCEVLQEFYSNLPMNVDEETTKKHVGLLSEPAAMKIKLSSNFLFENFHLPLMNFIPCKKFNLIYYDAFGPNAQPEMWEEDAMKKLSNMMSSEGVLVTYCAQGKFRRILKSLGFEVEKLPGPPGKREITRAIKL